MKKTSVIISAVVLSAVLVSASVALADWSGYNYKARVFVGTGMQWCMAKVGNVAWCESYLGAYANDKVVMKWNAEWDRGNAEGWTDPNGYDAWENNEWNGKFPGGSGAVWHYKIKWVGPCGADYTPLPDGGYCLWGQFDVLMDQGVDSSYGPGHTWLTKAIPNGYGN